MLTEANCFPTGSTLDPASTTLYRFDLRSSKYPAPTNAEPIIPVGHARWSRLSETPSTSLARPLALHDTAVSAQALATHRLTNGMLGQPSTTSCALLSCRCHKERLSRHPHPRKGSVCRDHASLSQTVLFPSLRLDADRTSISKLHTPSAGLKPFVPANGRLCCRPTFGAG